MSHEGYRALRTRAGLVTRPGRGLLAVTGSDRLDYLQGQLTNDVAGLEDGRGCYSVYLTPQGRIIADMDVFSVGDVVLLEADGSVRDFLFARFQELIFAEDVVIHDWTTSWIAYGVSGPLAAQVVSTALESLGVDRQTSVETLDDHDVTRCQIDESSVVVGRTDPLGLSGFTLWVEHDIGDQLLGALVAAGCRKVDDLVANIVRIENGRPIFPIDLTNDTIPLEAGIEDRAISFTKGCYVGQEVIVRILHRGQGRVARRLTGLTLEVTDTGSGGVAGATLWKGDRNVGSITSAAVSPAVGAIALGYVTRELLVPGTRLELDTPAGRSGAIVTQLPFLS